ncbi:MAG: sulfite exporter TauE/SafE family protein [Candidatus Rokuibacteriota bacterium]
MTPAWALGALIIAGASFIMGLAGFGIGLISLAFLPYIMPPATAVVLMTLYAAVFALAIFVPVRRDFTPARLADLVVGTIAGTPLGVWALASFPASVLNRLIGLMLLVAVALEWRGLYPEKLEGRRWGLGAGVLAGVIGGAVGTPGPPVILYATTQGWSPRAIKANLQAFFVVNQAVILAGYWWAGLLTREVWRFAALFAAPAIAGVAAGVALFNRTDPVRFRRIVFALLFVSGAVLLVRG